MREGIAVAGNLVVDLLYSVDRYPQNGELCTITQNAIHSMGGAVCNVGIDLTVLDPHLPIELIGLVGQDEMGDYILGELVQYPMLNTNLVAQEHQTSYTLVLSDDATLERTFFQYRGASSFLNETHFCLQALRAKMLHVGYLLLLDMLDAPDPEYGTKMARLLHHAQAQGIQTSIDIVSERSERFARIVTPALKYTDYCIINELEAQQVTGILLRDENGLHAENMQAALAALKQCGVSRWAVIHCPEGSYGMDENECYIAQKSPVLPSGFIKGTVGAGDAFCAGVLLSAYHNKPLPEALMLGTAAASCALSHAGATQGMQSAASALALYHKQMTKE